ncbi:MAG TPA: hypothetical protein VLW52_00750 [Opitutaceae bacterium]|nr:hypothetical protein [Opitutaceae bacterium]
MNISAAMFDELVTRFFAPLAKRAGLPLEALGEGIYEVAGSKFAMRIRRGTGHRKDFLVTLSLKQPEQNLDDLSGEIGLGVLADYRGRPLHAHALDSVEDWQLALEETARASEELCLPYLKGKQNDLDGVRRFIERKIDASGIRTERHRFPRNVREEWV